MTSKSQVIWFRTWRLTFKPGAHPWNLRFNRLQTAAATTAAAIGDSTAGKSCSGATTRFGRKVLPPSAGARCGAGFFQSGCVGSNCTCCAKSCGRCGGHGCADLPGGSAKCCIAPIQASQVNCNDATDTACMNPPEIAGPAASQTPQPQCEATVLKAGDAAATALPKAAIRCCNKDTGARVPQSGTHLSSLPPLCLPSTNTGCPRSSPRLRLQGFGGQRPGEH